MFAEGPDRAALEVDVVKLYIVNDDNIDNDDGDANGNHAAARIVRPPAARMLRLWRSLGVTLAIDIYSDKEVKISLLLASVLATPSIHRLDGEARAYRNSCGV